MKKLFQLLLILLGCLHLVGGPYCVMQGIAWTTMLIDYSKEDGLLKGAKDTFSGEKPCELCCKIQTAKQSDTKEKSPAAPLSGASLKALQELLPSELLAVLSAEGKSLAPITFSAFSLKPGITPASPPVPPPDRGAA